MAYETPGAAGTTSEYIQPQFSTDTNAAVAGGIQGMLGNDGYLNNTMSNWYDQSPAQGALGQYAQYDPSKMSQFMNPYTQNVMDANTQQSNQNLFENVLPGVNSTFTGAGQFGSTRNADFDLRAIRDNGQSLSNTNAGVLMNAQTAALNSYKDWTQMGTTAGQQDFTNWMQKANYPVTALGTLATSANSIETNNPLAVSNNTASSTDLERFVAAMNAANTGSQDGTIDWLTSLMG